MRVILVFSLLTLSTLASGQERRHAALSTAGATDLATGRRVFDAQCAWCHGAQGTGGNGPDLHRTRLRHAANDEQLVQIVLNGIPGTEMPSFTSALTDKMAWQIAAYVRSLGRARNTELRGDAKRGAAVYETSNCASCHIIRGRGGILGPELTSIGAARGAPYLRESILKPGASHPTGFLMVRAVGTDGAEVRGIRVNEDVFWVSIRDASGTLHTLAKQDLTKLERLPDASLMPSYDGRVSDTQLDDLVAYLATLRGELPDGGPGGNAGRGEVKR